jgi:hypothetical protein
VLYEERAVEVPQVQICEQSRQELCPRVQQVVREIPKVKMEYVEKVVEVSSKISSEEADRAPWQRHEQVISSGNFLPRGSSRSQSPMPVPPVPIPLVQRPVFSSWSPPGVTSRSRSASPLPQSPFGGWQGGSMSMASPSANAYGRSAPLPSPTQRMMSPGRGGFRDWGFGGSPGLSASVGNLSAAGGGSWGRNGYAVGPASPYAARGRSPSPMPMPAPMYQPPTFGPYNWPPMA